MSRLVPWFTCTLHSSLEAVGEVCREIRAVFKDSACCAECFAVELLARETMTNAVIHGNRFSADKRVEVHLRIGSRWIRLTVRDEGAGFAWRRCRRIPNPENPCGRGMALYDLYAHRVKFNPLGNEVTLWIRRRKQDQQEKV